jgi:hypothetical protein
MDNHTAALIDQQDLSPLILHEVHDHVILHEVHDHDMGKETDRP